MVPKLLKQAEGSANLSPRRCHRTLDHLVGAKKTSRNVFRVLLSYDSEQFATTSRIMFSRLHESGWTLSLSQ